MVWRRRLGPRRYGVFTFPPVWNDGCTYRQRTDIKYAFTTGTWQYLPCEPTFYVLTLWGAYRILAYLGGWFVRWAVCVVPLLRTAWRFWTDGGSHLDLRANCHLHHHHPPHGLPLRVDHILATTTAPPPRDGGQDYPPPRTFTPPAGPDPAHLHTPWLNRFWDLRHAAFGLPSLPYPTQRLPLQNGRLPSPWTRRTLFAGGLTTKFALDGRYHHRTVPCPRIPPGVFTSPGP